RVPQLDPTVNGAGEGLAVRAVGHGSVSLEGGPLLAAGRVPQLDLASPFRGPAAGGQGLAVRAESHGVDPVRMSLECGAFLAAGHLPHFVPAGLSSPSATGSQRLAVRAESQRRPSSPFSYASLVRSRVPQLDPTVNGAGEGLAVRAVGHGSVSLDGGP